jgi:hypothetical protein
MIDQLIDIYHHSILRGRRNGYTDPNRRIRLKRNESGSSTRTDSASLMKSSTLLDNAMPNFSDNINGIGLQRKDKISAQSHPFQNRL